MAVRKGVTGGTFEVEGKRKRFWGFAPGRRVAGDYSRREAILRSGKKKREN